MIPPPDDIADSSLVPRPKRTLEPLSSLPVTTETIVESYRRQTYGDQNLAYYYEAICTNACHSGLSNVKP